MVKFDQISKKRKLFFRLSKYGFFISIILCFGFLLINELTDLKIYLRLTGLSGLGILIFGLLIRLPLKKHKIIGQIGFTKELIEIKSLKKLEIIDIKDILSLDFHIKGYNGQAIYFNNIYPFSNGTSNFVVIQTSKFTKTIEFYLDSKIDLKNMEKITDYYRNKIKINIDERPKANPRYKAWRVMWNA